MTATSRPRRRALRRLLLLVALLVLVPASPAAADPPKPTNYRSEVLSVDPPTDAVRVEIVGGDAFVHLHAQPGHEVVVLGYDGEPYLRFGSNGTVEENRRSPAVLLNTSRYGTIDPQPDEVDPKAEPRWERIASDGDHAWHDHRVHWMGATPPAVAVTQWTMPLVVDGRTVTVHGQYALVDAPSPLPWLAIAAVLTALIVAVALARRRTVVAGGVALALSGAFAAGVSASGEFGLPPSAGRNLALIALPIIAALCGVAALVRPRSRFAVAFVAGGALTLPIWIVMQFGVLTHAIPATDVPASLQRTAVAVTIAATAACVVMAALAELRGPRPGDANGDRALEDSAAG
jgi:hypothetical protein